VLDDVIARTKEIDRLRAARPRPGKPKDHSELVADIERRLVYLRGLLTDS
jgi:hypothetical protein